MNESFRLQIPHSLDNRYGKVNTEEKNNEQSIINLRYYILR
jgi:hypothetical protein